MFILCQSHNHQFDIPYCDNECVHYGVLEKSSEEEEMISHKYVVQGRVLRKSWPIEETAWPHLFEIMSNERLEESATSSQKPNSAKKSKAKKKAATPTPPTAPTVTLVGIQKNTCLQFHIYVTVPFPPPLPHSRLIPANHTGPCE